MRFGLVGTGPWAQIAHGPGLLGAEGVELAGVWGRRPEAVRELADSLGVTAYESWAALRDDVDAVAFAVPPDVQAPLAAEAARAGKHLLLDKPVALDVASAADLLEAVEQGGVASVVFFTDRFAPSTRDWLDRAQASQATRGGWLRWFSAIDQGDNPFGASPWRQQLGALWDTAPHALSTLGTALGPVVGLTATAGQGDLVVLVLTHESGATSTVTLAQFAPPAVAGYNAAVWGEHGVLPMPPREEGAVADLLGVAATELVEHAGSGREHPVGVRLGLRVVELVAQAQAQVDAARG